MLGVCGKWWTFTFHESGIWLCNHQLYKKYHVPWTCIEATERRPVDQPPWHLPQLIMLPPQAHFLIHISIQPLMSPFIQMLAVKTFASNMFFGLEWDKPLNRKEETLSTPILHSYRGSWHSFCALMQVFIQDVRFSQERWWRCRSTGTWHCVSDCFILKVKAHDPPTCSMTLSQPTRSSVSLNDTVTAHKILWLAQWHCHSPQDPLSHSVTLSQPTRSSVSLHDTVTAPKILCLAQWQSQPPRSSVLLNDTVTATKILRLA
jgi:hypothetical protein